MIHTQTFLIKPSSSNCNLNCSYCFYNVIAEKRKDSFGFMTKETVEKFLNKVFLEVDRSVQFIFQGGEPLLVGLEYYKYFVDTCRKLNTRKISVQYSIQTNGVLINQQFADFFKQNNILIGVSLDGPQHIHDYYRDASHKDVVKAIRILRDYDVDFNILSVVTNKSVDFATEIFSYYVKEGFKYIQFIPYLNVSDSLDQFSCSPLDYGSFLVEIFDLWQEQFAKNNIVSISIIEDILKNMMRLGGATCGMNGICALNIVLESNGNVYPCDFFTKDEDCIGNIHTHSITDMLHSNKAKMFIEESKTYNKMCYDCAYRMICKGGCKAYKDENYQYYYCQSYMHLFQARGQELNKLAKHMYRQLIQQN